MDASAEIQLATRYTRVLEDVERQEHHDRRLAQLVCEAARSGAELTLERTPLLAEAGGLFAVEAPGRSAAELSSGTPFHADPPDARVRLDPPSP